MQLNNLIRRIPRDKWKHFIVGIGMGMFLEAAFLYVFHFPLLSASLWAAGMSIVIAYGFELFSLITGKGHYEVMDAIAGVLGAVIGMAVVAAVYV
jgi:glycopeptide antibiotics resistance protein